MVESPHLLDRIVESIQESRHRLFFIFRDVCSYHGNLHLLVVLFNGLGTLLEELQLLEYVTVVVCWHEACSHDFLHLSPSSDGRFAFCFSSLNDLLPPNENIVLELKGCHCDLLLFIEVVKAKDLVNL